MKRTVIVVLLSIAGFAMTFTYGALPQARTVADGVYTTEQSDRGLKIIDDYGCRNCHGNQFEGGPEEQPPLLGEQFVTAWGGRKLDELAEKITMMPADQSPQNQIRPAAAPDVIAFLLRWNGYPPGKSELPADPAALKLIEIVAPAPQRLSY